jgi:arylsulfatase A-like enzyme
VHTPIQAPEPLVEKYRRKAARLKLDRIDPFLEGEPFRCQHKQDKRLQRRLLQSNPTYAAMMENLDTNIGRVLQTLEEEGLAQETLVIFTADNGGLSTAEGAPTCNFPFAEGKGWNYEGGTRVCQLARWPGVVRPGSVCRENVTSTDFYPTFLAAAGLPPRPEQHPDGLSLLPLLREEGGLDREAVFWHYPHYSNQGGAPAASLVSGEWKLIEDFEDERVELYDLASDVSETRNLAEERRDVVDRLLPLLKAWQEEVEAIIPEPNPNYAEDFPQRPEVPNNAHE